MLPVVHYFLRGILEQRTWNSGNVLNLVRKKRQQRNIFVVIDGDLPTYTWQKNLHDPFSKPSHFFNVIETVLSAQLKFVEVLLGGQQGRIKGQTRVICLEKDFLSKKSLQKL